MKSRSPRRGKEKEGKTSHQRVTSGGESRNRYPREQGGKASCFEVIAGPSPKLKEDQRNKRSRNRGSMESRSGLASGFFGFVKNSRSRRRDDDRGKKKGTGKEKKQQRQHCVAVGELDALIYQLQKGGGGKSSRRSGG